MSMEAIRSALQQQHSGRVTLLRTLVEEENVTTPRAAPAFPSLPQGSDARCGVGAGLAHEGNVSRYSCSARGDIVDSWCSSFVASGGRSGSIGNGWRRWLPWTGSC